MSETVLKAPLTINWALNNSCNFSCRHCYSRIDTGDELDGATLKECLTKCAKAGVMAVNFGGGEPLLRSDILDIARHAADAGFRVSMNSNGYLIDRARAVALKAAGFAKIGISIDSHLADVHDNFRGMQGSHAKALAALLHLRQAGIKTSISTVICTFNYNTIDELISMARKHGASQLNFHNFKCSGLGLANKDELDLSPSLWKDFYRDAMKRKLECSDLDISLDDPIIASLGMRDESAMVKGSVCGKLSLNIKSNGDITPCGFIPSIIGNIVKDDLKEVWKNSQVLDKLRHKTPQGKCASCNDYAECLGGCSARALAMTGDFNNPDPHCWVEVE
ncbi:MAG TPA: GeoRSP system radical SAM/SPASM protein [Geobacteraceae bacterium]|nr:GeoRSP system radical SAM/SPASM protein [Geobacteraceae bacterium]